MCSENELVKFDFNFVAELLSLQHNLKWETDELEKRNNEIEIEYNEFEVKKVYMLT